MGPHMTCSLAWSCPQSEVVSQILQKCLGMPRPEIVQNGNRPRHARYGSPLCLLQSSRLGHARTVLQYDTFGWVANDRQRLSQVFICCFDFEKVFRRPAFLQNMRKVLEKLRHHLEWVLHHRAQPHARGRIADFFEHASHCKCLLSHSEQQPLAARETFCTFSGDASLKRLAVQQTLNGWWMGNGYRL